MKRKLVRPKYQKVEPKKEKVKPQPDPKVNHTGFTPRACALEVYNTLKSIKFLSIVAIGGYFIILLLTLFNMLAANVFTFLISMFVTYHLYKGINRMKYLEREYNIVPPKNNMMGFKQYGRQ